MRRTPEQLAALEQIPGLADPASNRSDQPEYARNTHRSIRPEVLVAVGICTHLGCSPVSVAKGSANPSVPADWPGGFFCPCHGSTFDLAGRVFANKPAPTNLEIPPHFYLDDSKLLIGEDRPAQA
jgi:ubiquinol-cytochrome c reductase iron-sulfur subunit